MAQDQRIKVSQNDPQTNFLENKIESTDSSISISSDDCRSVLGITADFGVATSPVWSKVTLTFADFNQALSVVTIAPTEWADLPAALFLGSMKINHTVAFTGGSVSAASIRFDWAPGGGIGSFDVFDAPSDTNNEAADVLNNGHNNQTALNDITAELTVTGDTCDNLVAGSVDVWFNIDTAP